MSFNYSRGFRLATLLVGASVSSVAVAQTSGQQPQDEAADESSNGEIIVTAQRRSESLQKVPMSVSVATGEQIQNLLLTDFKDVQQLSPGLEMTNSDGRRNVATIRGISFEPDSGADPAVDIYFNDIAADAQTVFGGIYDVGQVEILRGPQGIFRGRTSPAGAITLSTKRADLDEIEGYVQGSVSTRDAINAQGGVSLPLVPGKLAIRVAGLTDYNRGAQVRTLDGRKSHQNTMSGRLSLAFAPSERFRGNLMYQYFYSDTTPHIAIFGPGNTPYALLGDPTRTGPALTFKDRRSISTTSPRLINKTHFLTLDTEVDLTDSITWSTNAGYQVTKQKQDYPNLNTEVSVSGYSQFTRLRLPPKTSTLDTRISSDSDGIFNWMFGGYYQQFNSVSTTFDSDSDLFIGFPFAPLNPAAVAPTDAFVFLDIPIKKKAYAAFGAVRLEPTEGLRIEAGLRYNWFKFNQQSFFSFCLPGFGFCPVDNSPALGPNIAKRTEKALTGGATMSYDFAPDLTAYVAYGHSYRPTAAQNGAPLAGVFNPVLLLSKPEKSDAFEAGIKGKMLDGKLNFSLSGFYQKYKDYVAYAPSLNARDFQGSITAIPVATNGDALSKGVEAQFNVRVSDNFDLGLSASYVDAHYDNATIPCNQRDPVTGAAVIPAGQDFATCVRNDRISQVPKFTATTTGELRLPMGNTKPFVRWLANYRPGFNSITDNFKYRDILNVNMYLGIRGEDDRWEISLFAKNLLDQARPLIVGDTQLQQSIATVLDPVTFAPLTGVAGAPILSGYRTAVITPPREFGLTLRYKW